MSVILARDFRRLVLAAGYSRSFFYTFWLGNKDPRPLADAVRSVMSYPDIVEPLLMGRRLDMEDCDALWVLAAEPAKPRYTFGYSREYPLSCYKKSIALIQSAVARQRMALLAL